MATPSKQEIIDLAACPICGAPKGKPCDRGGKKAGSHSERLMHAQDVANGKPLRDLASRSEVSKAGAGRDRPKRVLSRVPSSATMLQQADGRYLIQVEEADVCLCDTRDEATKAYHEAVRDFGGSA
ncbi:MAG: hypothetical protein AAFN09_01465 [Pseudomonadota bacterium]